MFNANDILGLEKQWLSYKIKQKSKSYGLVVLFLIILVFGFEFYVGDISLDAKNEIIANVKKEVIIQKVENNVSTTNEADTTTTETNVSTETNTTNIIKKNKEITIATINENPKVTKDEKFTFRLEPTSQPNEMFSTSGSLIFHVPYTKDIVHSAQTPKQKIDTGAVKPQQQEKSEKINITIDTKKIDTITYLKNKFYSTSNIVFALMLSEEYYKKSDYKESLKWSLTANDIDYKNEKTWYWFAKSKVKLNQRDDAIRALKAFLLNNESSKLQTLLHKIEAGEIDD